MCVLSTGVSLFFISPLFSVDTLGMREPRTRSIVKLYLSAIYSKDTISSVVVCFLVVVYLLSYVASSHRLLRSFGGRVLGFQFCEPT